jgi:glycosyltransferase involved in cell wall biosynthesis
MPALRIALVSETWFPQVNGVSRSLEKLVEHLLAAGDRVRLFIPRYPREIRPAGTDAVTFPSLPLPFYREVRVPLATRALLRRELSAFAPDVVHIATEGPLGRAALRAAAELALPTVSSYHTNFCDYLAHYGTPWLERLAWGYLRNFHNATAATFCPTPSIRGLLQRQGFERVAVWSRGVDAERFHPGKRDPGLRHRYGIAENAVVLAYCGRLAAEKNLPVLLAAWQRISHLRPEAHLLLIGDGPLRSELETKKTPRTTFTGYLHGEELARHYAAADLFVFPSLSETFGNVLLEAMASGLPVLAFSAPGPVDIVRSGETGWLVEETGAEPLAAAADRLLADRERLGRLGAHARRYAAAQRWEAINAVVRDTYLQLAAAPNQPASCTTEGASTCC